MFSINSFSTHSTQSAMHECEESNYLWPQNGFTNEMLNKYTYLPEAINAANGTLECPDVGELFLTFARYVVNDNGCMDSYHVLKKMFILRHTVEHKV